MIGLWVFEAGALVIDTHIHYCSLFTLECLQHPFHKNTFIIIIIIIIINYFLF
jgi:hypothetical protein